MDPDAPTLNEPPSPAVERIDYIELPATDLAAAKAFYTAAFGWPFTDYGPTYAATGSDGRCPEVALSQSATPAPPHEPGAQDGIGPLVLFSTTDLQAVQKRVIHAGGSIVSEPYDYPGGQRFHFADPSGNILGVYEPAST